MHEQELRVRTADGEMTTASERHFERRLDLWRRNLSHEAVNA